MQYFIIVLFFLLVIVDIGTGIILTILMKGFKKVQDLNGWRKLFALLVIIIIKGLIDLVQLITHIKLV